MEQVGLWNRWAYVDADARDGALVIREAVEWKAVGTHVCLIANADTVRLKYSADRPAAVFPTVEVRKKPGRYATLLSIGKARREPGYEPEYI